MSVTGKVSTFATDVGNDVDALRNRVVTLEAANQTYLVSEYAGSALGVTATVDTAALAAAIAAAKADGGGIVELPPNLALKINADTIQLPSLVYLKGHGDSSRIVKQTAGDLFVTEGYLADPQPADIGIYSYGLLNLLIDGNGLAGDGLKTFGSGHHIDEVTIAGNLGAGWTARYGYASANGFGPDGEGLEGYCGSLQLAENQGGNLDFDGPHDSTFGRVVAKMATYARGSVTNNVRIGVHGGAQWAALHAWGNSVATAIRMEGSGNDVAAIYAEGAVTDQLNISGGNSRIRGSFQGFPTGAELPVGVANSGFTNVIEGTFQNCYGGAFVNNGGGLCRVDGSGWESPIVSGDVAGTDTVVYTGSHGGGAVGAGGDPTVDFVQIPALTSPIVQQDPADPGNRIFVQFTGDADPSGSMVRGDILIRQT